jgi:hypothetical protein
MLRIFMALSAIATTGISLAAVLAPHATLAPQITAGRGGEPILLKRMVVTATALPNTEVLGSSVRQ